MLNNYFIVIIGAGAAGLFAAIKAAEKHPSKVLVLEQTQQVLSKVKISGGGRCNVTHACFDPKELVKNYPRGNKELLGPFTQFQPQDTVKWFESRGVKLKVESDGRMFPTTDNSQTIIDCLLNAADAAGVEIRRGAKVVTLAKKDGGFEIALKTGETIHSKSVMLATGGVRHGHELAEALGHTIVEAVPSLFTFNIPNSPLESISGVSVESAEVSLPDLKMAQKGPFLVTHWGFSGPGVIKLSAWAARKLFECKYESPCQIDWLPEISEAELKDIIARCRQKDSSKPVSGQPIGKLPKSLWRILVGDDAVSWRNLSKKGADSLVASLKRSRYQISGKTTYKNEFVTAGGVKLSEVNFKRMESRLCPGLFFGGEILDIDGVTGGFNFQAAWTTGFLAGSAMAD
jgi:predicted Rossmann fold flavoprotein